MQMYHGTLFYAVHSRTVGTFGGRAAKATVKIYQAKFANVPACVLDQPGQIAEFKGLMAETGEDYAARDKIMAEFVKFGG